MRSRSTLTQRGYRFVVPTEAEREAYFKRNPYHVSSAIPVDRVECLATGKRLWASGLGIGSHERACPAPHFIPRED